MKKIFIALILIFIIFLLSGCGDSFKIPRVELIKNGWRFDNTYLPLRDNYKFAEMPYGIEETEKQNFDLYFPNKNRLTINNIETNNMR